MVVAILTVQPLAVQNIELSGESVLTVFDLQTSQGHTYHRELDGQTLTFRAAESSTVMDQETGSIWDPSTGIALEDNIKALHSHRQNDTRWHFSLLQCQALSG